MLHFFEFMDLPWIPTSLRTTLREALDCALSAPFRGYYDWVADEVARQVDDLNIKTVVEMGAGTAPITQRLADKFSPDARTKLVPCDLRPDDRAFENLMRRFPSVVKPEFKPIDMAQKHDWGEDALIVLSASFHHTLPKDQQKVLQNLTESSSRVSVFEPLRPTLLCQLLACASIFPAIAAPGKLLSKRGALRRIGWSWILPIAPLMLAWDGWVSSLRMWPERKWREQLARLGPRSRKATFKNSITSQSVSW